MAEKKKEIDMKEVIKTKAEEIHKYAKQHPLGTLGVVAGVSTVIGFLTGLLVGKNK